MLLEKVFLLPDYFLLCVQSFFSLSEKENLLPEKEFPLPGFFFLYL